MYTIKQLQSTINNKQYEIYKWTEVNYVCYAMCYAAVNIINIHIIVNMGYTAQYVNDF